LIKINIAPGKPQYLTLSGTCQPTKLPHNLRLRTARTSDQGAFFCFPAETLADL
jgi:hypothetical protein